MIRVLVVITTAFVPYGGLASVMMNLYRAIDKTRFHIDFASTNEELESKLASELEMNGSKYYGLGNRKKRLFTYSRKLNDVLKAGNYDVIHVNSNSATAALELWIAKKNGIQKRIVHNHTSICDHKLLNHLMRPFFDLFYTDAIACSNKAGEWLFEKNHFYVLNNGIDAEHYRYDERKRKEIRNKYAIKDNTVVIGHLGKIYKPKNHLYLVDVFDEYHKKNPDSCLLLVGDGEMRGIIEERVSQRGLDKEVIFAGMQRKTDAYLAAMDMFVFPSLWEGMPLSVIEAQASGLFCLISNTIDAGTMVTNNVRALDLLDGAERWSQRLYDFGKDKVESRVIISLEAISRIKENGYDSEANAKELEHIYSFSRS